MSFRANEDGKSYPGSSNLKLKDIFEALQDINLEDDIVDQETKPHGLGSSSDIFRARSIKHGKIVAVKRIRVFLLDNISFARVRHKADSLG